MEIFITAPLYRFSPSFITNNNPYFYLIKQKHFLDKDLSSPFLMIKLLEKEIFDAAKITCIYTKNLKFLITRKFIKIFNIPISLSLLSLMP